MTVDLPAAPTPDPAWLLVEEGSQPARERELESLMTVANGYTGTRGSLAEGTALSRPATFVAGAFDQAPGPGLSPSLVVAPDWTRLSVAVEGTTLSVDRGEVLLHRRLLDLHQAILWRAWRHRDPSGRITRLCFLRLASQADRHLLVQSVTITPENYSGRVSVELLLSKASVISGSSALANDGAAGILTVPFGESGTLALAVASAALNGSAEGLAHTAEVRPDGISERWEWEAAIGQTVRLDRVVAIATSRDGDPAALARQHLDQALTAGVDQLVARHVQAWEARWRAVDLELVGDEVAQRALRVAAYHLIAAANPDDERVSIGARALTGDAYKGHVFWDTEIYVLPFLTFTWPEAARALLLYRFHTLPAARSKAHRLGYRGALFAWESTDTGDETTPQAVLSPKGNVIPILTGELEHHISADIAYGVWQYWQATGDNAFFLKAGAEIMLETARFWASRGRVESDGRFHIRNVIGPDEYHEGVDDNAYTNGMAAWNLERGAETAELVARRWPENWQRLTERIALRPEEPVEWRRLASAIDTSFDPSGRVLEQFRGFFGLNPIDIVGCGPQTVPIDILLGREQTQRSQVVKQADVVALLALLWEQFPPQVREANVRYYEPRTAHGSSLSPALHALVAARLGDTALAHRYFHQTGEIDLANNIGYAAGGVHIAAMGGLWQAAVLGFAGLRLRPDGLALEPHLPLEWRSLRFAVRWRGQPVVFEVAQEPRAVTVLVEGGSPVSIGLLDGPELLAEPGRRYRVEWGEPGWSAWRQIPDGSIAATSPTEEVQS